jgi:hypothetical protein
MKKTTLIIAITIFFFIIFGFFLALKENSQMNLANSKTWWTAYFVNPNSQDLSFIIENHSAQNNFHWEIISSGVSLSKGDENIANNKSKTITITNQDSQNKKIGIIITSGNNKKEIYKNY